MIEFFRRVKCFIGLHPNDHPEDIDLWPLNVRRCGACDRTYHYFWD